LSNKCFGCGKFVKIGKGEVAEVHYPNLERYQGGGVEHFCKPCVDERVEFIKKEKGESATFEVYIGLDKKVVWV